MALISSMEKSVQGVEGGDIHSRIRVYVCAYIWHIHHTWYGSSCRYASHSLPDILHLRMICIHVWYVRIPPLYSYCSRFLFILLIITIVQDGRYNYQKIIYILHRHPREACSCKFKESPEKKKLVPGTSYNILNIPVLLSSCTCSEFKLDGTNCLCARIGLYSTGSPRISCFPGKLS